MARVTNRQKYSSTFVYNVYQLAFICIFGFCAYNALDVPDDMGRDFTVLVNMLPPMNPSTAHVMSIFIPAVYIACTLVRMFGPMYVVYRVMDKATTIEQCRVSRSSLLTAKARFRTFRFFHVWSKASRKRPCRNAREPPTLSLCGLWSCRWPKTWIGGWITIRTVANTSVHAALSAAGPTLPTYGLFSPSAMTSRKKKTVQ